jgi:hypothetical protein
VGLRFWFVITKNGTVTLQENKDSGAAKIEFKACTVPSKRKEGLGSIKDRT